jgi:hypothetical protein
MSPDFTGMLLDRASKERKLHCVPSLSSKTFIMLSNKLYQVNGMSAQGTPDRIQAMAPSHEHTRVLQSSKYFGNRAVKVVFH